MANEKEKIEAAPNLKAAIYELIISAIEMNSDTLEGKIENFKLPGKPSGNWKFKLTKIK